MSESELPLERPIVADTVVVNYFLAVGAFDLLSAVLGGVVQIPRAVFDPDEPHDIAEEAASELRRGLRLHRQRSTDTQIGTQLRERSVRALPYFETLPDLASTGRLAVLDLTTNELCTFARLRDASFVSQFSLVAGLGRGEAAALAIALERRYNVATDDQDALRVASRLAADIQTYRIRALLLHASDLSLITRDDARNLHTAMKSAGFWDKGRID